MSASPTKVPRLSVLQGAGGEIADPGLGAGEGLVELAFQQHHKMVFRIANRMLRDRAEAEDATQAVFATLLEKAGSLRDPAKVFGFLRTSVVRQCLARQRHGRVVDLHRHAVQLQQSQRSAGDAHLATRAQELLDRLPLDERNLVILRFVEQYSFEEIVATTGIPRRSAHRKIETARARLRQLDPELGAKLAAEMEDLP